MMDPALYAAMEAAYAALDARRSQLVRTLSREGFRAGSGWYNGHYRRTGEGWRRESCPIPVVEVAGVCDVELSFDGLSVSAKLARERALEYDYGKLAGYSFEAFGVEHYLLDFYRSGRPIGELAEALSQSGEREVGFAFSLPVETEGRDILELVQLLAREGFYA